MRSLILAATATLAVISSMYLYNETYNSKRFLSKEVYTQTQLDAWTTWKMNYGKTYGTNSEEEYKKAVFMVNYHKVNHHNSLLGRTYEMALNYFADLTSEEFVAQYTGFRQADSNESNRNPVRLSSVGIPDSKDWRGVATTDIKDQGHCGSCWSFSTTGAVEGAYAIKNGTIKSFSEQQLVDCASGYGNNGCHGGLMDHAFNYVKDHGLEQEGDYSYSATDGHSCRYDGSKVVSHITGYTDVQRCEGALKAAVAQQPVSVAINAHPIQLYHSGIFGGDCPAQLNHGVLAVGYGSENGKDYWIVKNSWGTRFGENGYFRIRRTDSGAGLCGIATAASYPNM